MALQEVVEKVRNRSFGAYNIVTIQNGRQGGAPTVFETPYPVYPVDIDAAKREFLTEFGIHQMNYVHKNVIENMKTAGLDIRENDIHLAFVSWLEMRKDFKKMPDVLSINVQLPEFGKI